MANFSIVGNGPNSTVTLFDIHDGNGYFRKDVATTHSQVELMQRKLTDLGYDTLGADGKFGNNTLAAVKAFQRANGLTVDGYFGRLSLEKLETLIDDHLDLEYCEVANEDLPPPIPVGGIGNDAIANYEDKTYKTMTAERVNSRSAFLERLYEYNGISTSLTVNQYLNNLRNRAENVNNLYTTPDSVYGRQLDCSGYTMVCRNDQGYHGATTNFCKHLIMFGSISDIGRNNLEPGMELYEAYRKEENSPYFYAKHMGVYAGKHDFGDGNGLQHAVYQSSSKYTRITRTPQKSSGPVKSIMSNSWTYWGWSKYIILE